jgi:hypothetical protein
MDFSKYLSSMLAYVYVWRHGALAFVVVNVRCLRLFLACSGSGRRVGENCEHTWAAVRAVTKLTRYMGKRRYLAALDTAFQLLSEDKLEGFIAAMVASRAACIKKLGEQMH